MDSICKNSREIKVVITCFTIEIIMSTSASSQEMSQMKIHLQQALAGRAISDEMCSSLQVPLRILNEYVRMTFFNW